MPYGRGEQAGSPIIPGTEVNRLVTGSQLYWNGLTGTRLLSDPTQWAQNGGIGVAASLNLTPNSPIGDDLFWNISGAVPGDSISQILPATFDGGAVYIASLYIDATNSTSTAARIIAVFGGVPSTIDFNPLNGTIIATSGPGAFTAEFFVVGNNTYLRVLIRVASPAAASPNSLEIVPTVPPSAAGAIRVQAPLIAVTFDAALALAANSALFQAPAYVESNRNTVTFPAGVSTPGAVPQYQAAAPFQIYARDDGVQQLNFSGALGKTITYPPGTTPSTKFVPSAILAGKELIPPGWFCWLTQGNQPGFPPLTIDFSAVGQTVYIQGLAPQSGPTVSLPSTIFPSASALLLYLGGDEWALLAATSRREVLFSVSGTFFWPYGVTTIYVDGAGGGGGGGGGSGTGGTPQGGGGGGAADATINFAISGPVAGSAHAVTIGGGGAGGFSGAIGLDGAAGVAGTATNLGALLTLAAGGGGSGGSIVANVPGIGGLSGGAGGQTGNVAKSVVTGLAINGRPGGNGGSNIAGGIGGSVFDNFVGVGPGAGNGHASAAALGGGGAGGNVFEDGAAGANGYLLIRW